MPPPSGSWTNDMPLVAVLSLLDPPEGSEVLVPLAEGSLSDALALALVVAVALVSDAPESVLESELVALEELLVSPASPVLPQATTNPSADKTNMRVMVQFLRASSDAAE
jgi:hypothetical protein